MKGFFQIETNTGKQFVSCIQKKSGYLKTGTVICYGDVIIRE